MIQVIGFDTETYLIGPGRLAPRMVCASFADEKREWVEEATVAVETLRAYLKNDNILLVGHNLAFDTAVICAYDPTLTRLVFEKYRKGLFACTKVRQMLQDIATGQLYGSYEDDGSWTPKRYGLADLCIRFDLPQLDKSGDSFRLRYWELDGVRASEYPPEAYTYAARDAGSTRDVFFKQGGLIEIIGEKANTRAHFALQLSSVWGIRTDPVKAKELERQLTIEADAVHERLAKSGIFRADGTKDTKVLKALVVAAFEKQGLKAPTTEKGAVKCDADTLNLSGDEDLMALGEGGGPMKLLNTYVPIVKLGTVLPLQPGYEVLVVTGRTSSKSPTKKKKGAMAYIRFADGSERWVEAASIGLNIQNLPRDRRDAEGNIILGIRQCYVPRVGYYFSSVDWSVAEMRALGEVQYRLFGRSALKDAFDNGIDPHYLMAAELLDWTLEETLAKKDTQEVKDARQFAKIPDFSLPGGLGVVSFIEYARLAGYVIDDTRAREIIAKFHKAFPEMRLYFDYINSQVQGGEGTIEQIIGEPMLHGARTYTQACNLLFQGGVAQIAKEAVWRITWECYYGTEYGETNGTWSTTPSELFGSRMAAFIHDETLLEVPIENADKAARRQTTVMVGTMDEYLENVGGAAEPALCTYWDKDMKMKLNDKGELIPWVRKPKEQKVAA